MKFSNYFKSIACALGCAALLSSCLGGDKENKEIYTQSIANTINVIFAPGNPTPTYATGVSYQVSYNYTDAMADVDITGLSIGGNAFPALKLSGIAFTQKNGWRTISAPQVNASSNVTAPTFNNFQLGIMDRQINGAYYYPCLNIRYSINGYDIIGLPTGVINIGDTSVTDPNGEVYVQPNDEKSTVYSIALYNSQKVVNLNNAADRVAILSIDGAKFASNMPAMNMAFTGIPYDVLPNGTIELKSDELTPSLVGSDGTLQPYSGAVIKDLHCLTDDKNNMQLTFTCEIHGMAYQTVVNCTTPKVQ